MHRPPSTSHGWIPSGMRAYANPSWNLVSRVLAKVQRESQWISCCWLYQSGQPNLVSCDSGITVRLSKNNSAVSGLDSGSGTIKLARDLAVWPVSSIGTKLRSFQKELQTFSWCHGGRNHQNHMIQRSRNGWAGVMNRTQIPFLDIYEVQVLPDHELFLIKAFFSFSRFSG